VINGIFIFAGVEVSLNCIPGKTKFARVTMPGGISNTALYDIIRSDLLAGISWVGVALSEVNWGETE
jgi:hypothetical protein